ERGGSGHLPLRRRCGDLGPRPDAAAGRRGTPGAPRPGGGRRQHGPGRRLGCDLRARRRDAPLGGAAGRPATRPPSRHPGTRREGGGGRHPDPRRALPGRGLARRLAADAPRDAPLRRHGAALGDAGGGRLGPGGARRWEPARRRPLRAAAPGGRGDARRGGSRLPGVSRQPRLLPVVRRAGGGRGGARAQHRLRGVGRLVRPVVRRARGPYNHHGDRRGRRHLCNRKRRGTV
ncbi:MAG: hypothetical protein AVDCRST_MAG05-4428, partial [uncultured Rubrobacteraceae bacterium]